MTGTCQLCGTVIAAQRLITHPDTETELVQQFDGLAAQMLSHIASTHRQESETMVNIGLLASKVFAMTFVESAVTEHFDAIRAAWRDAALKALQFQEKAGTT